MLFLILLLATVVTICVLGAWSWPNLKQEMTGAQASTAAPPGISPVAKPESLEGVLVGKLMAGEITPAQYQRAVEGLASRDEDRHPLTVPPEIGSADA